MSDEKKLFGEIDFTGKDIGIPAVKFDKLAISGRGELLLVSLFAESQRVKAIRAILCGGAKAVCNASGIRVKRANQEEWYSHTPGRLTPSTEGYQLHTHKLGFGLVHALFVTRMPGFMKVVTGESLWQELKDIRFTTPVIREWVPYIEERLRADDILEDAQCFNCLCGVLTASTKKLDEIVGAGLAGRDILIPQSSVARGPESDASLVFAEEDL